MTIFHHIILGLIFFILFPIVAIWLSVYVVTLFRRKKGNEFERYYKAKAGQREESEKTKPKS